jgi:hypothetical protein
MMTFATIFYSTMTERLIVFTLDYKSITRSKVITVFSFYNKYDDGILFVVFAVIIIVMEL